MNNEFDDAVASSMRADAAQSARVGFSVASDTNPDAYAEAQRVARRTGVPVDTVLAQPSEMKRQDAIGSVDFDALAKTSPATAALLSDVEKAKVSHDNIDSMTKIESALYNLGKFEVGTAGALASAVPKFNEGAWVVARAGADLLPDFIGDPLSESFARMGRVSRETSDAMMPRSETLLGASWYSGMQSLGLNATLLPLTLASGGTAGPVLAGMGLVQGGQSYGEARDKGIGVLPSLRFAALQGGIEAGTEMFGMPALLSMLKPGKIGERALEYLFKEQFGEQVATHLQDLNEWAVLNPDKPFTDYLAERPAAALQTALSTAFSGGGQVAVMKGLEVFARRNDLRVQQAEASTELLARLNQLAVADKVLQRDPVTFEQFVAQAAENGPVQQVFIDGRALLQSGIAEQLAAVSPAVADQLATAVQTGGQIAIPVEEYAARIAPTEYAQSLLDHLKTEPEGFSRAEAQEYMQTHADDLRAEVEKALNEQVGDEVFKLSAEAVRANIKQQLDAAARFTPQVNDAYAAMVGNFYAVQAARLGVTPDALYERYPLKVGAERIDGQQFEQAAKAVSMLAEDNVRRIEELTAQARAIREERKGITDPAVFDEIQRRLMPLANELNKLTGHPLGLDDPETATRFAGAGEKFKPDEALIKAAAKEFGVTSNPMQAGYILPSGKMLNFGEGGVRGEDHRAIARIGGLADGYSEAMIDFMNRTGAVRVDFASGLFEAQRIPTVAQMKTAVLAARQEGVGLLAQASRPNGDQRADLDLMRPTVERLKSFFADTAAGKEFFQGARGSFNPATLSVSLLKGADLSTFLHESGHAFLEIMADMAAQEDAPAQVKQDMASVLDWFGVKSLDEWSARLRGEARLSRAVCSRVRSVLVRRKGAVA